MTNGGTPRLEAGVSEAIVEAQRRHGHNVVHCERTYPGLFGGYQSVWLDPETGMY